jgi:hypothetical protein
MRHASPFWCAGPLDCMLRAWPRYRRPATVCVGVADSTEPAPQIGPYIDIDGREARSCLRGRRGAASGWWFDNRGLLSTTACLSTKVTAQSPRPRPRGHRSAGWADLLEAELAGHAAASSRVQRNSVPSDQMRCMTMESLRATATTARRMPRRLATAMPHALSDDQRCDLVSNANEAW